MNKVPQHIAIIMDGNGRWAKERGLPRIRGHQSGADRVLEISRAAQDAGVKYLTLYSFSKENWQRPKLEVNFLMGLLADYLDKKMDELKARESVFNTIGDISDLPQEIQQRILKHQEDTKGNPGMVLTFALSYSSRHEITQACQKIAEEVAAGKLKPGEISESLISKYLYTSDLPEPDLLIRTSGEMRISNFLLWQISYSELYVTNTYWPDFDVNEFQKALDDYAKRERRFGLTEPPTKSVLEAQPEEVKPLP